jgi:hypothetical protein
MTLSPKTTSQQAQSSEDKPLVNFDLSSSLSEIDKHLADARRSAEYERLEPQSPEILVDTSHVIAAPESIAVYTPPQPATYKSHFLAELEEEAAKKLGASLSEAQALQIRSQKLHEALNRIVGFFSALVEFANEMEPEVSRNYRLDARTCFSNLKWKNARLDARKQNLSSTALIAYVTFSVNYQAPEPLVVMRPWSQVEALKVELENLRLGILDKAELDGKRPKQEWLQVHLSPDLPVFLKFQANYEQGYIDVLSLNLLSFGISSFRLNEDDVRAPLLDDLGRVLLGRTDKLPDEFKPA